MEIQELIKELTNKSRLPKSLNPKYFFVLQNVFEHTADYSIEYGKHTVELSIHPVAYRPTNLYALAGALEYLNPDKALLLVNNVISLYWER